MSSEEGMMRGTETGMSWLLVLSQEVDYGAEGGMQGW